GLLSGVTYDPDAPGHIHRPIDFAPESGTLAASLFDAATLDRHLDVLQAAQQPDGGWEIDFPAWCPATGPEWRGSFTLGRLRTLRSYGRLQQRPERDAGQLADLVRQVRLVGVPVPVRDVGERCAGTGRGHRTLETHDPLQRLGPVPEQRQATSPQLPFAAT